MKFYIEQNEKRFLLNKVVDGYIEIQDEKGNVSKIDLAIPKKVIKVSDDGEEYISIAQYLVMSDQLKEGNEWEINKWMLYLFFSTMCSIINGMFSFVGFTITLYTIPCFLISLFCCYQLYKIKQKQRAIVLFIFSIVVLFTGPISQFLFNIFFMLTT